MPLSRSLLASWLVVVAVFLSGACYNIASSSLGGEGSAAQRYRPASSPVAPTSPIDRLRLPWNSEAAADWPAAEVLASISKLSYLSPADAERSYRSLGFQRIRPLSAKSLDGYVVSADDVAIIVFRGTDEASEWIVNLGTLSYYTPQGDIHEGYYRAYRSLKPQVMKLLKESKPQKIWITGHSLGEALALVCAYDMITDEKVRPFGLMTFGQPMVVDQYVANYLDNQLFGRYVHFVNGNDIVPRLPPGYAHCGSLVWFTGGEIVRSKPKHRVSSAEFDKSQPNRNDLIVPLSEEEFSDLQAELQTKEEEAKSIIRNAAYAKQAPVWIRDHAMTLYLKKVESVRESSVFR